VVRRRFSISRPTLRNETIKFRPIPPRSPHLNGKVERAADCPRGTLANEDAWAPDVGGQLAVCESLQRGSPA
jgi:hypothetical protein